MGRAIEIILNDWFENIIKIHKLDNIYLECILLMKSEIE